ncbi:LysR family transcriptional regulator [Lactobacillus sp. PSON]|uniref:LysR family transcriptional regulator n=1 Tax=Lactobacillus sp. PSON TaxID=3455454 RepID=UPI0040433FBE
MNLNQLYYFRELAEQRQYTKAADSLFISQPTLSVSIKQLEKELHCKLFKHSGRYVELTKYGRIFYNTVVSSLTTLDNGKRKLKQTINQDKGNIHIAGIPTTIGTLLPKLVASYQQIVDTSPHFIYHDNPSYQICKGIENGWYDLGICSFVPEFKNFTYIPFYTEDIVAIVSEKNELAQINEITPEELRGESLITYSQKIQIGKDVTNALLSIASDLNITNRMHDELAIAGQVLTNNIIGIVADTIYLDGFDIHKIKLDIPKNTRTVYLVYDPERYLSPEILDFIDFLNSEKSNINKYNSKANSI